MDKFIQRPVLSIVISLMLTIMGALAIIQLPVAQFPEIAPPVVGVTAEYAGANAETSVKAVIRPLEMALNGVPGMKYMSSDAGNDGTSIIRIAFETGTDADIAAVNVQNRVASVIGKLPEEVRLYGVKVSKEVNSILLYLNISSSDESMDEKFIHNFVHINVLEELRRIKGVGFIDILGQREYAIRVWLKPDRLSAYKLSVDEVIEALQEQNIEAAPGKVGESSMKDSQSMQYILKYTGRFTEEEEYKKIPIRATSDGLILRLGDVADIEFSTAYYDTYAKLDGKPSAAIIIKQLPGTNAQEVIENIKSKMEELKEKTFLPGMDYSFGYDVSRFLSASMAQVLKTFLEAFLLVSLVVFIFLGDVRSTLIPAIAVPVSLIGTFFFMQLFGFSINMITLFALVLAIGIVVDNAIVVVEAVHAEMEAKGVNALTATRNSMKKITGAIVAITLVMSAVYIPMAFMSGPVGVFYRQFSITLAISIILSGVVALTLTPALCAILLKNPHHENGRQRKKNFIDKFISGFNRRYNALADKYRRIIELIINRRAVTYGALIIFCLVTFQFSSIIPTGFIPNEDQGILYANVLAPPGATVERTQEVVDAIQDVANSLDAVQSVSTLAGTNIFSDGTGAPYGTVLINLKNWSERKETVDEVAELLREGTRHIKDANIDFLPPPAVPGYGNAGGFELRFLDKTGSDDLHKMESVMRDFVDELRKQPEIESAFSLFDNNYPQYLLRVDYDRAAKQGVSVNNAMTTLQTLLGGEWASDFIRYGKTYRVMVQAHPGYRAQPEDILKLYVKNKAGEMVPYASFMEIEKVLGPEQITRYNMYTSAEINGEPAQGYSSGSAIAAIQRVAAEKLPRGYDIAWAGMTYDEVATGDQAVWIFLICLLFVYLLLCAQYESFLLPLSVILSLPVGIFGAFFLLWVLNLENNIYAQVAMVMLIGMLGKNAILVVEFALQRQREGLTPLKAAIEGATERLRPILMTSFAFTAGLIPLVFASGAGSIGNKTIGAAAAGGMVFGTLIGVLLIPGLYFVFASLRDKKKPVQTGNSIPTEYVVAK
ncbi:RND efflux system, inner membrane transporter CmeB [Fulvivirga imtechensis AK7]|uniref:RND efflux system, inner membrane transporter CmeB n=1 Tax=Fulvivirga imtechensis AK7 TaxID=1237149 RepID=L8JS55_9BACT|nr:efflux RND transporter permease subunit [Fulvivirga imtechensis]ELR70202.1 RND efflux system, inner membrane transporter CmeB [Fulvivirga imtechensis AK7]